MTQEAYRKKVLQDALNECDRFREKAVQALTTCQQSPSLDFSAAKRASLDLSRALTALRKSYWDYGRGK